LPGSVIQVDGEFNTVRAMDNYYIDSRGGIIDKSTMIAAGLPTNAAGFDDLENVTQQGAQSDSDFTDDGD
jgi:hypothetical protein